MMKIKQLIFFFLLLLLSSGIRAQKKEGLLKRNINNYGAVDPQAMGDMLFDEENYLKALPYYIILAKKHPRKLIYKYKMGICYLYKTDELDKAMNLLSEVLEKNKKATGIHFFLGKAYLLNYKFDEATEQFNLCLEQKKSSRRKAEILTLIDNCRNGKELIAKPVKVKIENIGNTVNTQFSEYVPLLSSDQQTLIYTYRGEKSTGGLQNEPNQMVSEGIYFEDIFISEKDSNEFWSMPISIGSNINGNEHDACIALSPDGQKLFIYKIVDEDGGDIYVSNLEGKEWETPKKLEGGVNTNSWEGSASLSADEKMLYFSSERPGGYGGKDLYQSTLQEDGSWGNIKNLGANVNTINDEDAPYIHPNGKLFLFSSKGHNSMGGYDIFYSDLKDSIWGETENVGYPINTTGDDLYYVLSSDTKKGYYSSGKAGGYGLQDIYTLEPGLPGRRAPLIMMDGEIALNDKPARAEIIITNLDNNKNYGNFHSNSYSGKYLANLQEGTKYKVTYKIEGLEDKTQLVNAMKANPFFELTIDMEFFTDEYIKSKTPDSLKTTAGKLTDLAFKSTDTLSKTKGVIFKIQIGSFYASKPAIIEKYSNLSVFGDIEEKIYDQYIRYTIGSYSSLKEANRVKHQIIENGGINDAFVVAFYKGKRVPVSQFAAINNNKN